MAQFTVEELYRGDKYNIIGEVVKELIGSELCGDELLTAVKMLTVKHTLIAAEKMRINGDRVSDDFGTWSPFSFTEESK